MVTQINETQEVEKLAELVKTAKDYDSRKNDFRGVDAGNITVTDTRGMIVEGTGYSVALDSATRHAWQQMCARDGRWIFPKGSKKSLPFGYYEHIPDDLFAHIMNRHLSDIGSSEQYLIRAIAEPDENGSMAGQPTTVRAMLSDQYATVDNSVLLQSLHTILRETQAESGLPEGFHLVRPKLTEDSMYVPAIWSPIPQYNQYGDQIWDDDDGGLYIGTIIVNDEIGKGRVKLLMAIQRGKCDNTMAIRQGESAELNTVSLTHRGSVEAITTSVQAGMFNVLQTSGTVVDKILHAKRQQMPSMTDVIRGLAINQGLNKETEMRIQISAQGNTQWDLINAVTLVAHADDEMPDDEQQALELLGGDLLFSPASYFNQLVKQAEWAKQKELVEANS